MIYTLIQKVLESDVALRELLRGLLPESRARLDASPAEVSAFASTLDPLPGNGMPPGGDGLEFMLGLDESKQVLLYLLSVIMGDGDRLRQDLDLSGAGAPHKHPGQLGPLATVTALLAGRERGPVRDDSGVGSPRGLPTSPFLVRLLMATADSVELADLVLADAAARLGLSERSLQRRLKREGLTWREYKQLRRLRQAMALLRFTDLGVAEIAGKIGYGSVSHFSRIFREHTGATPMTWRKAMS